MFVAMILHPMALQPERENYHQVVLEKHSFELLEKNHQR